jgi:RNA polymerase sigma factor (sigma-70 family)
MNTQGLQVEVCGTAEGMKEYRLDLRIKNNLIAQRIQEAGYKTVAAFCRARGFSATSLGGFLNLRKSPLDRWGRWVPTVKRLAAELGVLPEELFTPLQLERQLETNRAQIGVSEHDLAAITGGNLPPALPSEILDAKELATEIERVLRTLTPRQAEVIRRRFGLLDGLEYSLQEIGEAFNVTRERVRQIEVLALRRLRHPWRCKNLKLFAGGQ